MGSGVVVQIGQGFEKRSVLLIIDIAPFELFSPDIP